jgi:hypothetical protein
MILCVTCTADIPLAKCNDLKIQNNDYESIFSVHVSVKKEILPLLISGKIGQLWASPFLARCFSLKLTFLHKDLNSV